MSWSFGLTPKYKEELSIGVNYDYVLPLVLKTIEELGWQLIYYENNYVKAERRSKFGNNTTEEIKIEWKQPGKIQIKSESNNNFIDFGKNHKRVQQFKTIFYEISSKPREIIQEIKTAYDRKQNMDDYEVSETLPTPKIKENPSIILVAIGAIVFVLLAAYVTAFIQYKREYLFSVFELFTAFGLSTVIYQTIRKADYVNFKNLFSLAIVASIIFVVTKIYFDYNFSLNNHNVESMTLIDYLDINIYKNYWFGKGDYNWIVYTISKIIQTATVFGATYFFTSLGFPIHLSKRVPTEVLDFVYYLSLRNKTEQEIRNELSKKGWSQDYQQEAVFEAFDSIHWMNEYKKG